jgi:transposase InsO family protein
MIRNNQTADVPLCFEGISMIVNCRVVPLSSFDVILGRDWIAAHVLSTNWTTNEWSLCSPENRPVLFTPTNTNLASISSAELLSITDAEEPEFSKGMFDRRVQAVLTDCYLNMISDGTVLGPREDFLPGMPSCYPNAEPFRTKLIDLANQFAPLFEDITHASNRERVIQHLVDTGTAQPVHQPVRQLSPALLGELKTRLEKLQAAGFIRPSTSPWSSPILFAKNPNSGKLRLCVDYRALNAVTKKDRHPIPLIQECFDSLKGARFFSKIDLQQGFHQMKIAETNIPRTTFGTKYGHFEWTVMPFGLVNAPSTFQRMMTHLLREFIDDFVQVYLDDILIYSASEEDHLSHVERVMTVLRREELKCSGPKCSFGQSEIQFVGHVVSYNSVRPMADKLKCIEEWPRPSNVHDVWSFLGFCGYYRRYVKNFARLASPLHDLPAGAVKKRAPVTWLPVHETAFLQLKEAMTTAPVLVMPDLTKPFVVETDASDYAVGAVLLQKAEDKHLHPVAFESCKLNSSQRKYPAQEQELLAILHAWRKWKVYLDGAVETTIVYTDHSSLQYLATQKLPSPRLCRWINEFSEMDILVKYKRGADNIAPDALSRRSDLLLIDEIGEQFHETDWPLILPYLLDGRPIPADVSAEGIKRAADNANLFEYDPQAETLLYLGRGELKERSPFISSAHRYALLKRLHDEAGHRGRDATLQLLRGRGWWPRRYDDVKQYIRTCASCQIHERSHPGQETGVQVPLPAVGPFERWAADFISMPESYQSKYRWILTIIDHCTSWPVAVPMKEATAGAISDALLEHVITPFGVPKELLTDRGANFMSSGLKRFLKTGKIKKLNTSGYHPRTNGKSERYNGILEAALFKLNTTGDPSRWEDYLPAALYSTRVHASDSSKFSPFELTYGVKPRLPSDPAAIVASNALAPGEPELRARIAALNATRLTALKNTAGKADKNKAAFDASARFERGLEPLQVGQSVKLRNESHTKGAARWFGPFEIKKALDNNVYILIDQGGAEYSRPVNGNDLRPVSLRSLITNDMWATPPAIAQKVKRAAAKVDKATMIKAKAIAITPPTRLRVKFDGRFLRPPASGSGTDPPGEGGMVVAGLGTP